MARPLPVVVVDCGSAKVPDLAELLSRCGADCVVQRLAEVTAQGLRDSAGVVISGGPHLFTAEPGLIDGFAFIDELCLPTLGICLGHQALALRHGGTVHLGPERRQPEPVSLTGRHPLLAGLTGEVLFAEDHCEGVSLPTGFRLLGSSEHYEVEIMASRECPLYGVQFHPEISGAPGERLLDNFVGIVRQTAG